MDLDDDLLMGAIPSNDWQSLPTEKVAAAGLRALGRIADAWHLSLQEQLALLGLEHAGDLNPDHAVVVAASRETMVRLSAVLGIYKALQILFPDPHLADGWIRRPNAAPLFAGRSAVEVMTRGALDDLMIVRRYLDAVRGGGWS